MAWREVGTAPSTATTGSVEGLGQGRWGGAGRSGARCALVETGKIKVRCEDTERLFVIIYILLSFVIYIDLHV